ncbi:hypothetical protein [Spongiimicrobium salis]|uniref:hypothetical protein n=1 Tax=Spongiimicrobium salis TaxID=1667022 RepID=UPI00374CBEB4
MKYSVYLCLFVFFSCSTNGTDDTGVNTQNGTSTTLAAMVDAREVVVDNVIACAGSNEDPSLVSIYLYPREGVTNIRYFETSTADQDKNDYQNYTEMEGVLLDVFNGYLLRYEVALPQEKWIIVSFEEEGKIHLSNPIRLKHRTKPTEYLPENVSVDISNPLMPTFVWTDGVFDDSKIYFHVVSDTEENLLSGTYTFERRFQFYNLDNVVLNITEETPPELVLEDSYNFTLLAVSEDNWVNLFAEVNFDLQ